MRGTCGVSPPEIHNFADVREHQARLISLVLGDAAQALEVQIAADDDVD